MKTNWQTKKLGEVCEVVGGGTPKTGVPEYWSEEVSWVTPKDLGQLKSVEIFDSNKKISKKGLEKSSAKLLPKGSVVLSSRAPIGYVAITGVDMATNQGCRNFVCGEEVYNKFLYYFLSFNTALLNSLGGGSTFKEVSGSKLKEIEIPVPPLVEQKKIVKALEEKLDKVKEAIQLRQDAIADTEKILSAKLSEIFTEGKEEGWKEKRIDEISDIKGGKRLPKGEKLTDESTPHPYIRVTDFKGGQLKEDTIKYLSEEIFDQISRYTISSNDIFVSIAGTVGLVHKIPKQYDGASLTENAAKITNIDHSVRKDYLYWLLNSDWIQNELKGRSIQTTISKLALYKIGEQKIVYPDLKTQEKIIKELDELRARVAELHALQDDQLADLKSLERAYLHEAFNGELA
jgi:type I restriction enzyme S subunit